MKLHPGKNLRMFQNDTLELFTYVHPIIPMVMWGPVAVYCFLANLVWGDLSLITCLLCALGGVFAWTFNEYFLHRFIFHFKPKTPFQSKISFLIHGVHHEDPEDQRRLLMPPVVSILLAIIFYSLFYFLCGPIYCKPAFSGFVVGYLCYDYIHFATHYMKPKNRLMFALKQNHMKHHFTAPNKLYGVSSTLWDFAFRTRQTN